MQEDESSDGVPKRRLGDSAPDKRTALDGSRSFNRMPGDEQWNDWRWQIRNRIRNAEDLSLKLGVPLPKGVDAASERFPFAITPYYLSLMGKANHSDPIYRMSVPSGEELCDPEFLKDDPLGEEGHMPVDGLVHRYRDRALVLVTTTCSMYCRHCTRKRIAGQTEECVGIGKLDGIVGYLREHPEIKDVIVSGGDPLTMSTQRLREILSRICSVESVETIRIGTRTPVVLPMRVDEELVSMLREFHPLWINTHFNHPSEITPESSRACRMLADAGIPLGNQSVLLRGVNDDPLVMEDLCRKLVRMRVRPYYMFQCDLVRGVEGFRTPVSKGIEILEHMRGRLSGIAIPTFVVDAPGGGGKIPILPNYVVSMDGKETVLRNFEGKLFRYPEPS